MPNVGSPGTCSVTYCVQAAASGTTLPVNVSASSISGPTSTSWTPTPTSNGTFSSATGTYGVIGNLVYVSFDVTWSAGSTGNAEVNGLPFAHASGIGSALSTSYCSLGSGLVARIDPAASRVILGDLSGNALTNATMNGKRLICSGVYRIA